MFWKKKQDYRPISKAEHCKIYDVITVGSATVDVFVKTKGDILKIKHPNAPEEHMLVYPVGTKILIEQKKTLTGGGGTNTAVSFSRIGLKTAFLGKLGNGELASTILNQLQKENVQFIGTKTQSGSSRIFGIADSKHSEEQTGYSVILDSIEHDRTILTYKGINDELSFSEINKDAINAKWMYFSSMTGNSYKTLEKLALYCSKKHILIAFNPSSYLCKQGYKFLKKLLLQTNVLVLNLEEARILTGKSNAMQPELLKLLRRFGPKIIVITDGKNLVQVYDGHYHYSCQPRKVKVIETTGAGDAFASAFVAGLIQNKDISHAIRMGLANSESIVTHFGAKTGLLKADALQRLAKKQSRVIKEKLL